MDVHDISLEAADDRTLVASDGLHPSATQYARWVDRIEPVVKALLAAVVYEKVGLRILRRAWINLNVVWSAAMVAAVRQGTELAPETTRTSAAFAT